LAAASPVEAMLVATRNPGKVRELLPLLTDAGYRPVSLSVAGLAEEPGEDALEVHETFEENALAKARWFFRRGGGVITLADDSGLAVKALGGAPGVRSKRFSGSPLSGQALDDENNRALMRALAGVARREARYVAAAAIVWAGGEVVARGECAGRIVDVPRGEQGFGYDPYFRSDELAMTFGEAVRAAKERVSHRGRAVRKALELLAARLA